MHNDWSYLQFFFQLKEVTTNINIKEVEKLFCLMAVTLPRNCFEASIYILTSWTDGVQLSVYYKLK